MTPNDNNPSPAQEPSTFERQQGQVDLDCLMAVQDLFKVYGPTRAMLKLSNMVEDEIARVAR